MNPFHKLVGPVMAAVLSVPVALSGTLPAVAATLKRHIKGSDDAYNAGERIAFQFFLDHGYKPAAAAGIVGNLSHESKRFSPDVISGRVRGDSGRSAHVAQWNGQRLVNLRKFAGTQRPSLTQQLSFILEEMDPHSTYSDTGAVEAAKRLRGIKSVATASDTFREHYERPSARDKIARRVASKRIAQQFVHTSITPKRPH